MMEYGVVFYINGERIVRTTFADTIKEAIETAKELLKESCLEYDFYGFTPSDVEMASKDAYAYLT